MALGVKAAAMVSGILATYHQDLAIIANEAIRSELCNHILAIPVILGYLIYRKRKMLKAVIPLESNKPKGKTILNNEMLGALTCLTDSLH